jgi:peptide/nickel transport system substrate-binding protein
MRTLAIPLLVTVFAISAGCGSPSESKNPDTLVIAWDPAPANLDSRVGADISSGRVADLVYAGLIQVGPTGDYHPDLAESWDTPDDRTIVFRLRPGVTFHDGRPLTSRDVRFTFESLMSESFSSPKKSGYVTVSGIETPDDLTVVFELRETNAGIFDNLTVGIVPHGTDTALQRTKPIAAGPYRVTENLPDERLVLEAFEDYHGGAPPIRRVVFRIIPDTTTRILELERGSVNLVINALPLESTRAFQGRDDLAVISAPGSRYEYIAFNLRNEHLADVRVRQAFAHAIDRERIVRDLLDGHATLAESMLPEGHWAYPDSLPTYPFDPARAKALLDEAGLPDSDGDGPAMRFTITYRTSQDMEANQRAEMIQQMLAGVGIGVEIRSTEFAVFYEDIQNGRFEIFSLRRGGVSDPDFYNTIFHSASIPPRGQNRGAWKNPRVDELIMQGRSTFDRDVRRRAYVELQEIAARELPYLSLYHLDNVAVMDRRLEGIELHPSGFLNSIAKARLVEGLGTRD